MKSKELIRLLQEEDPTGEVEVSVGNVDIYFLVTEPAYWDGSLQTIIRDESKKPYYHAAGVKYHSSGSKIVLHTLSAKDILWNDPDAVMDYSDLGSDQRVKWYKEANDKTRELVKDSKVKWHMDHFYEWAKSKTKGIHDDLAGLRSESDYLFQSEKMHPDDPMIDLPPKEDEQGNKWQASINDRRFAEWDAKYEVLWTDGWTVQRRTLPENVVL